MRLHIRPPATSIPSAPPTVWHCFCGVPLSDDDNAEPCGCSNVWGDPVLLPAAPVARAWSLETSDDRNGWCSHRPSHGQSAVTALYIQFRFGGRLLRTVNAGVSHYWNELPDGTRVDLTRDQFDTWDPSAPTVVLDREAILAHPPTAARYRLLVDRLAGVPV